MSLTNYGPSSRNKQDGEKAWKASLTTAEGQGVEMAGWRVRLTERLPSGNSRLVREGAASEAARSWPWEAPERVQTWTQASLLLTHSLTQALLHHSKVGTQVSKG